MAAGSADYNSDTDIDNITDINTDINNDGNNDINNDINNDNIDINDNDNVDINNDNDSINNYNTTTTSTTSSSLPSTFPFESSHSLSSKLKIFSESSFPLLDLRSPSEYVANRLLSSRCLNLSAKIVTDNCFQLPPREKRFGIVVNSREDYEYWLNWLECRHWKVDSSISYVLNNECIEIAKDLKIYESGEVRNTCFLFEPCHLLIEYIDYIELSLKENDLGNNFTVCDVGCGCGRDSLYLASRKNFNWNLLCADSVAPHLERINTCAKNYNLDNKIKTTRIKIHDNEDTYHLVLCVRFLERNFMKSLKKMVKIGGFILYLAFTAGAELFDHPKDPKSILTPNELFITFCEDPLHKFECIVNRVDKLSDGRPVQAFIAKRIN